MGKGDLRTRRGKIKRGTTGRSRPRHSKAAPVPVVTIKPKRKVSESKRSKAGR